MGEVVQLWADESGGVVKLHVHNADGTNAEIDCRESVGTAIQMAYLSRSSGALTPRFITLDGRVQLDREALEAEIDFLEMKDAQIPDEVSVRGVRYVRADAPHA